MRIHPAGERSLLVDLGSVQAVHRLWAALAAEPPGGTEDIVAGARTVLVILRPGADRRAAAAHIRDRADGPPPSRPVRELAIPVVYDGPDLAGVAELAGLDPREVVELHAGASYVVAFLGFSPGFAYLTGLPSVLHAPRLDTPRTAVPAGSVAIAAGMTAVYPQPTPGGWRLIGRSDAPMFDPDRAVPSLVEPGDRVRFVPVERLGGRAAPRPSPSAPVPPGHPYLEVLDAGPLTTVQDAGRTGWAHLGVPSSGAADRRSAAEANRLVGNAPGTALLEATLAGPRLRIGAARTVAVTGAGGEIRVDGLPARHGAPLRLAAGSELWMDRFRSGVRAYVAVAGGIAAGPVLGSRSCDTLSGLGPPPLRAGDRLPLGLPGPGGAATPTWEPPPGPRHRTPRPGGSEPGEAMVVTAYRGPRDGWVGPAGMRTLTTGEFTVRASSDRTGVRLAGPAVEVRNRAQLPSEGMPPGAVQIPPDGQPIVLLRNRPTTGGYPVAAVVTEEALDLLAQTAPGTRIRFEVV